MNSLPLGRRPQPQRTVLDRDTSHVNAVSRLLVDLHHFHRQIDPDRDPVAHHCVTSSPETDRVATWPGVSTDSSRSDAEQHGPAVASEVANLDLHLGVVPYHLQRPPGCAVGDEALYLRTVPAVLDHEAVGRARVAAAFEDEPADLLVPEEVTGLPAAGRATAGEPGGLDVEAGLAESAGTVPERQLQPVQRTPPPCLRRDTELTFGASSNGITTANIPCHS